MKRLSEMAPLEPSRGGPGSVFLSHPDRKHADPSKSSNRHRPSTVVSMLEKPFGIFKYVSKKSPNPLCKSTSASPPHKPVLYCKY